MKILKYILLLLALCFISLTVFIATKTGVYSFSKSKEVELPQHTLFAFVAEYKNWNAWYPELDPKDVVQIDSLSKGAHSGFHYQNLKVTTDGYFANDSLQQTITHDKEVQKSSFTFKKTDKGTLVTWTVSGEMNFLTKLKAFFSGGAENILGGFYEKGLNNINHYLTKEIASYSIESNGIVTFPATYYIKQNVDSSIDELGGKIFQTMQSMKKFVEDNHLQLNGSPFTIFEQIDLSSGQVSYAVCLPIKEEIYTSEGSDIISGKVDAFYAYKTILKGDYSHSDKAWNENRNAISKYKLTENTALKPISIYKNSVLNSNKPSEWITEILTPVLQSYVMPEDTSNEGAENSRTH